MGGRVILFTFEFEVKFIISIAHFSDGVFIIIKAVDTTVMIRTFQFTY